MESHVLQTRPIYEHTSTHLAGQLQETMFEWKLEKPDGKILITTVSARITGSGKIKKHFSLLYKKHANSDFKTKLRT